MISIKKINKNFLMNKFLILKIRKRELFNNNNYTIKNFKKFISIVNGLFAAKSLFIN